ncbi:SCP-like protein [Ancylostoma duodenale]|uniref:SCP-like protein n=1 Tax=Ancylostoma duodenale TaxID=51022 RepID=A0A0C2FMN6_9BILA|nr:SCP-like protein [Ancylostoma duodenale]
MEWCQNENFWIKGERERKMQSKSSGKYKVEIPKDCGTPMTAKMRRSLLLSHNKHRSRAARGKFIVKKPGRGLKKLPTAARMPALKYNCSLEQIAMKWGNQIQCKMIHSDYFLGENLYGSTGIGDMASLEKAARVATDVWVKEIDDFGISASLGYEDQIGHATQVKISEEIWLDVRCTKKERRYQNVDQEEEKRSLTRRLVYA